MKIASFLFLFFSFPLLLLSENLEITHGPYLQQMGENEVTIVWTTNNDAVSWVELAPEGNDSFYAAERAKFYDTSRGNRVIGRLHKVTLKKLTPGTKYRYRVFSKEVTGYQGFQIMYGSVVSTNVYSKEPLTFTTLNKNKPAISFRVVNDIHARHENLNKMLQDVNKNNTDLVFFNGDMISTLNKEEEIFSGFMDTAIKLFASEVPVFYTRGNHETRGKASAKLYDYFPSGNGQFYYAFRHGPVAFLVLDSGEDKPDSDIEYSDLAQYDDYRTEEQAWIEKVVHSPEFTSAPFRIVIMHIPPAGSTWHGTLDVTRKFVPVLNDADIDVMLCGHTHNYQFIDKNEEPSIHFPILINDDETSLNIKVGTRIDIEQVDLSGTTLHKHSFQ